MSNAVETTTPTGPGSVSGAPNLPDGFSDTFTSRLIEAGDLRMHAVTGSGIGHWLAEQAPEEIRAALSEFLAPYGSGS